MSYVYVITDYFIEVSEDIQNVDVVKIGFTSDGNIYNRIRQLQTGNPRPLQLIELHEFQNVEMAKKVEKLLHWSLGGQSVLGEWFQYTDRVKTGLRCMAQLSNYYPYEKLEEFFSRKGV